MAGGIDAWLAPLPLTKNPSVLESQTKMKPNTEQKINKGSRKIKIKRNETNKTYIVSSRNKMTIDGDVTL